jgi:hypothetical protein
MEFLLVLGIIYLAIGFVYAVYILIRGKDPWYAFPINLLGGPVVIVQMIYLTKKGKRPPLPKIY